MTNIVIRQSSIQKKIFWGALVAGLFTAISTMADPVNWIQYLRLERDVYVIKTPEGKFRQVLWFQNGKSYSAGDAFQGNHRVTVDLTGEKSPFGFTTSPWCKLSVYLQNVDDSLTGGMLKEKDILSFEKTAPRNFLAPYHLLFAGYIRGSYIHADLECHLVGKKISQSLLNSIVGTSGILLD